MHHNPPITRRVRTGSAELYCEVSGEGATDGETLVLLHAGVCDRRSFGAAVPKLSAEHRTVAYDRRGFGDTTGTPEPFCHVADLLAVIDNVQAEQAVLVGHSQGGRVATDFALEHPDRVKALLLVAPAIRGAPPLSEASETERWLAAAIDAADEAGELERVNQLEARLWLDGPDCQEGRVGGEKRALFLDMNGRALRAASPGDERPRSDAFDRLHALAMPVAVLLGELDRPGTNARGREVARRVARGTVSVCAGVAHLPPLERPDEFVAYVLQQADAASSAGP